MNFFTFFTNKKSAEGRSSEFSRFFREASSSERERVFMDVAHKANEDQLKVITDANARSRK